MGEGTEVMPEEGWRATPRVEQLRREEVTSRRLVPTDPRTADVFPGQGLVRPEPRVDAVRDWNERGRIPTSVVRQDLIRDRHPTEAMEVPDLVPTPKGEAWITKVRETDNGQSINDGSRAQNCSVIGRSGTHGLP